METGDNKNEINKEIRIMNNTEVNNKVSRRRYFIKYELLLGDSTRRTQGRLAQINADKERCTQIQCRLILSVKIHTDCLISMLSLLAMTMMQHCAGLHWQFSMHTSAYRQINLSLNEVNN
jgi:hypothetical protein